MPESSVTNQYATEETKQKNQTPKMKKPNMRTEERLAIRQVVEEIETHEGLSERQKCQVAMAFCEQAIKAWEDFDPGLFMEALGFSTSIPLDPNQPNPTEEEQLEAFLATI
jgi:hypothetical protein